MNLSPCRPVRNGDGHHAFLEIDGKRMRSDMAKVIVERPRRKGRSGKKPRGYRRQLRRYGEDGPPRREGIKERWRPRTKDLNEHLGPLRRYLDSQVGRPWDQVFSEICAHIDRSNAVQDHVRDHVADYVTTHVLLIDGVPCSGKGGSHGRPLSPGWWYVCPRTGLLQRVKAVSRKRVRQPDKEVSPRYVPVGDALQCRFLDGAWHLVTLKPLPDPLHSRGRCGAVDVLLKRPAATITPAEARRLYGAEVYATASRRLARRELSQYPIPVDSWT